MRLIYERKIRGWSQTHLGNLVGMHQTTISSIEVGRLRPTHNELARIAKVLDVDPPAALLDPAVIVVSSEAGR